jgi:hypothetical protein
LDSSAFRQKASVLVAIFDFDRLGFPWILSRQTGLFNGLWGLSDSRKLSSSPDISPVPSWPPSLSINPGRTGGRHEAIEPIDNLAERPDRRRVVLDDQARCAYKQRLEPLGLDLREVRLLGFAPLPPGLADDLADALRRQPLPLGDLGNPIALAQPLENPRPPRPPSRRR